MNRLHYGDNLTLMQRMPAACVDLIYLDPPFKSNQNYNLIYGLGQPIQSIPAAVSEAASASKRARSASAESVK